MIFIVVGFIIKDNIILFENQCRLKDEAMTDELTGLKNYRYVVNHIYGPFDNIKNNHKHVSLLMIDIDKFKRYNDTYGHIAGNKVLKGVSDILKDSVREGDIVARYGGEEFLIILNHASIKEAYRIAERIRRNVSKMKYTIETTSAKPGVTVSIGVSEFPIHGDEMNELINKADIALYKAKELGRNNVQIYKFPDKEELDFKVAHAIYK